ncbi:uncharacterized protein Hap1MRO34_004091 [Clarias gariepinus]|uniref:uncharacterized protein LOC128518278 n=1 Tax=Clarias gariepinus TaxID=13013 RepID=UPI00234E3725|nr:uncharacterized protein LOC128518278 [Clarias gariepinus]
MRIIQLHFYLLVCCGAAESFTEKSVDLGQNVTLKCEVSVRNVLWFLMKPSEPPVFILRSFSSKTLDPQYSDPAFSKRFSVQYNSSLFIHNISTNELGVYYCNQSQTGSPPVISRGIRLYIQNNTAVNLTEDNQQVQNHTDCKHEAISTWSRPLFISVILNCTLAFTVAVLIVHHCKKSQKTQAHPPDPGLQPQQHDISPLYAQVQNSATNDVVVTDVNSTYVLLQHPNPCSE